MSKPKSAVVCTPCVFGLILQKSERAICQFSVQIRDLVEKATTRNALSTLFSGRLESSSHQRSSGRNCAIVIAESLARVIAAIRITNVCWGSYLSPKHRFALIDPAFTVRCLVIRIAVVCVRATFIPRGIVEWPERVVPLQSLVVKNRCLYKVWALEQCR